MRRSASPAQDDEDETQALFQDLARRVTAATGDFPTAASVARGAGITLAKLDALLREQAHLSPTDWLRRTRVRASAAQLLHGTAPIAHIGSDSGFASEPVFESEFLAEMRMAPAEYRALDSRDGFQLHLPDGYRPAEVLAYHGRDPDSLTERTDASHIWKALTTSDGPVVLELALDSQRVAARIHSTRKIGRDSVAGLHSAALRMLGLLNRIGPFERRHAPFVQPRRGLRIPLLPNAFEALCWAITGQQINLKFAGALRGAMIRAAGKKIGAMRAHPTADELANVGVAALTNLRYSGSKARYLVEAAAAVASGQLDLETLAQGSAVAAEKALVAQRGIGVWTARYVLMRSGFADSAPVGDSGLATALQRLHRLPERPDSHETTRLMSRFAPDRSLATMHLWTSLKEASGNIEVTP